jgi:hypothetical protein
MIINGGGRGSVSFWSKHLTNTAENERAEVVEISGVLATDLPSALREMEAIAGQSRCRGNFMYQANINPERGETLTPEQWQKTVDTLEKNLGLEGHQRVVVEHEKDGRTHRHVIWNRVDVETLRVTDIGGNFYTHERTQEQLSKEFGLHQTPTLHGNTREGGRPERAPEVWEKRAAERSGISPNDIKAQLTMLRHETDSGKAFAAGLEEKGFILANGDRRGFVVLDQAGTVHSLARRLDGMNTQSVNECLSDIDRTTLPTVEEARATQRGIAILSRDKPSPAQLNTADLLLTKGGQYFGLETPEQQAAYKALAAVALEDDKAASFGKDSGLGAAFAAAAKEQAATIRQEDRQERREAFQAKSQENWKMNRDAEVARVTDAAPTSGPEQVAEKAAFKVAGFAGGLADFASSLLAGSAPEPAKTPSQVEQIKAQRRALVAVERLYDSMDRGEAFEPSDVRSLTPTHLEQLRLFGDGYMRKLLESFDYQRREQEQENDYGRGRER